MAWHNLFHDMAQRLNFSDSLMQFMSEGGAVIWWLAALMLLFWLVAIERLLYLFIRFPKQQQHWLSQWSARKEYASWYANKQKEAWLSQAHMALFQHMNLLKLCISLFPMLGLLGTVIGMITVFDVLATQGTSQPELMADGISMATLPTMAGMVAALTAMFFYSCVLAAIEKKQRHFEKLMRSQ